MFIAGHLAALWNRVTVAAPSIVDEQDRRSAQRVAGFLLAAIVVNAVFLCAVFITQLAGVAPGIFAWGGLLLALAGFYIEFQLARHGHFRFASLLFITTVAPTAVFVVVFIGGKALLSVLNYASAAILLATFMHGWRSGVRVTAYNMLWTFTVPLLVPDVSFLEVASSSATFQVYMLAITIAFDHLNRQRMAEQDVRRQALHTSASEALNRLRLFVEQAPSAIIEWDAERRIKAWNPAAARLFGYAAHEAVGREALDLLVPTDSREQVGRVFAQMMNQTQPIYSTNENLTADGRVITCAWVNVPLIDAQGKRIGLLSMANDVTEQKAETQRISAMLVSQTRAQTAHRFGRVVAHYMRNHVSEIELNRHLTLRLIGEERNQDATRRLELMRGGVDRLVDQLSYLNLALGLAGPTRRLHDARILVGTAVFTMRQRVAQRALELDVKTPDKPIMIHGDGPIVCEALHAMLQNAIDQTPSGEKILVELSADDKMARISIHDGGPALTQEQMGKVFDLFYGNDDTHPDDNGAVNLGLNVAQWIADEHGGQITMENQAQTGNAFTLWLPLAGSDKATSA
ncbi:MAG: PAS domain S-box protein [Anaerolineae bacterium]|nr:PAS domain S-box protein [Anaerolineae bacterium]